MTAHIVNAENPSPAPTHSVPGVPVVSAEHPSAAPAQSQPSMVPAQEAVEPAPEPAVEVHDHAVEPTVNVDTIEVSDSITAAEQLSKRRGPKSD